MLEHFIGALCIYRERRNKFESYLINERKKMETFRLRETKEFLSIDELKEKCDMVDNFMETLKVQTLLFSFFFVVNFTIKNRSLVITKDCFGMLHVQYQY